MSTKRNPYTRRQKGRAGKKRKKKEVRDQIAYRKESREEGKSKGEKGR